MTGLSKSQIKRLDNLLVSEKDHLGYITRSERILKRIRARSEEIQRYCIHEFNDGENVCILCGKVIEC